MSLQWIPVFIVSWALCLSACDTIHGQPNPPDGDDAMEDAQPEDGGAQSDDASAQQEDGGPPADAATDAGDDNPDPCALHDAVILGHTIPGTMDVGAIVSVSVTVGNSGASTWTEAEQFRFGSPENTDPFVVNPRFLLPDDVSVPGNPDNPTSYAWEFEMLAPAEQGTYLTDWQMLQEHACWFGEVLELTIEVVGELPTECGEPLPPWEDERSKIKMHCGNPWCDATPSCHGCEFCAAIGMPCMPGTGPEPPCTPRCDCPPRPEGHPERIVCETYFFGGDPLWRSDGTTIVKPDNRSLARCEGCTWIEVCRADGTMCTRVTF